MKEGFTFNKVSLMFLRKVNFKNFDGGGENRKEPGVYSTKDVKCQNQYGKLERTAFGFIQDKGINFENAITQ